jgi:hypothetical protein
MTEDSAHLLNITRKLAAGFSEHDPQPKHREWITRIHFSPTEVSKEERSVFYDNLNTSLDEGFKKNAKQFFPGKLAMTKIGGVDAQAYMGEPDDHAWLLKDDALVVIQQKQVTGRLLELVPAMRDAISLVLLADIDGSLGSLARRLSARIYGFSMAIQFRFRYDEARGNLGPLMRLLGGDDGVFVKFDQRSHGKRSVHHQQALTVAASEMLRFDLDLSFKKSLPVRDATHEGVDSNKLAIEVNPWISFEAPANENNRILDVTLQVRTSEETRWTREDCLSLEHWAAVVRFLFGEMAIDTVLPFLESQGKGNYEL